MNVQECFRQLALSLVAVVLFNIFLYQLIDVFQCGDVIKVSVVAALAIIFMFVGLFKFYQGLSFCFVFAGIIATMHTCFFYVFCKPELFRFVFVMIVFLLIVAALFNASKKAIKKQNADSSIVNFGSAHEWILSMALLFFVPFFVVATINVISPAKDFNGYTQKREMFFGQSVDCCEEDYIKEHCCKYLEWKKNREIEWESTEAFLDYKKQKQNDAALFLLIACPISFFLLYAGSIFIIPAIGASFILSVLPLQIMVLCPSFSHPISSHGINLKLFELLFLIIGIFVLVQNLYVASQRKETN